MAVTGMQRPDFRTISDLISRRCRGCSRRCWLWPGGAGQARPCGAGRHQDQGQRLQAQGDVLRPHGQGGGRARGGGRSWLDRAAAADAAEARVGVDQGALPRFARPRPPWRPRRGTRPRAPPRRGRRSARDPSPSRRRMCRRTRRSAITDPESRILKTKDGFIQGYNAQAAVMPDHGPHRPATGIDAIANLGRRPIRLLTMEAAEAGHQALSRPGGRAVGPRAAPPGRVAAMAEAPPQPLACASRPSSRSARSSRPGASAVPCAAVRRHAWAMSAPLAKLAVAQGHETPTPSP